MALVADDRHQKLIESLPPVENVHFDDMESWIHTKLKPVAIPPIVMHPKRLILAFGVVSMPAKGKLAKTSVAKYGRRPDHRKQGLHNSLTKLKKAYLIRV